MSELLFSATFCNHQLSLQPLKGSKLIKTHQTPPRSYSESKKIREPTSGLEPLTCSSYE
jgi:hypothetical protein